MRWLDRKSFAFQWMTFAVTWWVLQVRFAGRKSLRDVLFIGESLLGTTPPRHRARVHAAYVSLVHGRVPYLTSFLSAQL